MTKTSKTRKAPEAAAPAPAAPAAPAPAPEKPLPSKVPAYVFIETPLVAVIFRRAHAGRPAEAGAEVGAIVRKSLHECESRNVGNPGTMFEAIASMLVQAGFQLAGDFSNGHAYAIELTDVPLRFKHSFTPTGANPDDAEIFDRGSLRDFQAWALAEETLEVFA